MLFSQARISGAVYRPVEPGPELLRAFREDLGAAEGGETQDGAEAR